MTSVVPLKDDIDYPAPDGSEIRMLCQGATAGLCHCVLPAGQTSSPVKHRQVEELWYVLEGQGEIWHEAIDNSAPIKVGPGTSVVITPRSPFQFRAATSGPLKILIATIPRWRGREEAVPVTGFWE